MPTPTERLEARRLLVECRLCAWLVSLPLEDAREWQKAIMNPKYSAEMVSDEIMRDPAPKDRPIGDASVTSHRRGAHRPGQAL